MTGLSVVIPTRNRRGMLLDALIPVLADPAVGEVVVVDDGSTDGTREALASLARRDARLVAHHLAGGGPGPARQHGALHASGELLLFLEDDVHVTPGLASAHVAGHADRDDLLLVGYTPVEMPPAARAGDGPVELYAREYERVCRRWEADPDGVLRCLYGGHLSMRRDRALAVGLVSPLFPERCHEDQDFGLRCLRAGLRARFDRDLVALHRYRRDLGGFLADARCRGAGKFRVHDLHPDLVGALRPADWWSDLPRPVAALVRATSRPGVRAGTLTMVERLARIATAARLARLELAALQLARRVLLLDGARAASRGADEAGLRVRTATP